jgi:hypothetical protein
MGALRSQMPFADLRAFDADRRLIAVPDLFTVGLLTRYIAWKLETGPAATVAGQAIPVPVGPASLPQQPA